MKFLSIDYIFLDTIRPDLEVVDVFDDVDGIYIVDVVDGVDGGAQYPGTASTCWQNAGLYCVIYLVSPLLHSVYLPNYNNSFLHK